MAASPHAYCAAIVGSGGGRLERLRRVGRRRRLRRLPTARPRSGGGTMRGRGSDEGRDDDDFGIVDEGNVEDMQRRRSSQRPPRRRRRQ